MTKMAKDTGVSRFELRKSVEEFKEMTPAQRRSFQAKKNIKGDKMTKIIDEYTNIQNSLKDLSKNYKAEIIDPDDECCSPKNGKEDEKNLNLLKIMNDPKKSR
jgi:Zn-dependent peptidase ImmA (M78 family)